MRDKSAGKGRSVTAPTAREADTFLGAALTHWDSKAAKPASDGLRKDLRPVEASLRAALGFPLRS